MRERSAGAAAWLLLLLLLDEEAVNMVKKMMGESASLVFMVSIQIGAAGRKRRKWHVILPVTMFVLNCITLII